MAKVKITIYGWEDGIDLAPAYFFIWLEIKLLINFFGANCVTNDNKLFLCWALRGKSDCFEGAMQFLT